MTRMHIYWLGSTVMDALWPIVAKSSLRNISLRCPQDLQVPRGFVFPSTLKAISSVALTESSMPSMFEAIDKSESLTEWSCRDYSSFGQLQRYPRAAAKLKLIFDCHPNDLRDVIRYCGQSLEILELTAYSGPTPPVYWRELKGLTARKTLHLSSQKTAILFASKNLDEIESMPRGLNLELYPKFNLASADFEAARMAINACPIAKIEMYPERIKDAERAELEFWKSVSKVSVHRS